MKGRIEAIAAGVQEGAFLHLTAATPPAGGEKRKIHRETHVKYTENNTFFSPRKGEFFKGNGDLYEKSTERLYDRLGLKKRIF